MSASETQLVVPDVSERSHSNPAVQGIFTLETGLSAQTLLHFAGARALNLYSADACIVRVALNVTIYNIVCDGIHAIPDM